MPLHHFTKTLAKIFRFHAWLGTLLFIGLGSVPSWAQALKGVGFSVTHHAGQIIKHTEKLTFELPDISQGTELSFTFRTYGRQDWEAWRKYPILGLSLHHFSLGTDELGHAYGFYPFIDIPLWGGKGWKSFFQVGSGIAWLTRPYDRISNPNQNAIGSRVNNSAAIRIHGDFTLSPSWLLTGGFSFTHYSNGKAQIPNFGINIVGGSLGVQWTPSPLQANDYREATASKARLKKWGFSTYGAMAYREYFTDGGPRFPVYIGSAALLYQHNRINRFYAGLEYEYQEGLAVWSKLSWQDESEEERFKSASRVMVFIGEEFLYGPFAILLQAGTYWPNIGILIPNKVYTKLGMRYYLPKLPGSGARFFGGVYLKSHMITAEHISMGLGVTFD